MEKYSAMNHKKSTQDSYRSVLDLHLHPYFEDKPLDQISRKDVKHFLYQKQQGNLSAGTAENCQGIFKLYFDPSGR